MSIVRIGSTKEYAARWEKAFGKKTPTGGSAQAAKKTSGTGKKKAAKKTGKAKKS